MSRARRVCALLPVLTGLAVLLALAGCRPSEGGAPAAAPLPPTGALDLRDAPVTELVGQLAGAVGTPITVDTAAVPLTRCARVTLVAPPGTPRGQLIGLATGVLRSSALALTDAGDHLSIARIEDADVPADCARTVSRTPPRAAEPPAEPSLEALLEARSPEPPPPPMEGIRLLSEGMWEVDPDSPTFAEGPAALMRSARIVPHAGPGGTVDGMRLYAIRRDTLLSALGFQNGDTVRRINGREVYSPDSALETYAMLREAERIEVELERRGAPLTFVYLRRSAARRPPAVTGR